MSEFKHLAGLTDQQVHEQQLASVPVTEQPRDCDCVWCQSRPRAADRLIVNGASS